MQQSCAEICPYVQWVIVEMSVLFKLLIMKLLTSLSILRIIMELEFRRNVLMMDTVQIQASQKTCRVSLQQVPSAGWRRPWAGPSVWFVLCIMPPGLCATACGAQGRFSLVTWGTIPGTMCLCMSCWVWVYPCCSSCRRSCCRCTLRLCLMGPALCSLCWCGCRKV